MCLAIPMKLVERQDLDGTAELRGVHRKVSLMLCQDASVGDYLLVHAGYAISTIDADEAAETMALIEEVTRPEELP